MTDLVQMALQEDMPRGDLTTDSLSQLDRLGRARLVAKEDLVLSGTEVFQHTVKLVNPDSTVDWQFKDSAFIFKGQTIAVLKGSLCSLLKAERVALNFLGHLSGIATLTRCYVREISHTSTQILDTRKTLPGLRSLEKLAVLHGGGKNHRLNLSEGILIKENHIRLAGGIEAAVLKLRAQSKLPIEVEVTHLEEVATAVSLKVNRIMLDNMSNESIAEALKIIPFSVETEASGNMNLERVKSVAELGVTYISVGAITHSAPSADISLLFEFDK